MHRILTGFDCDQPSRHYANRTSYRARALKITTLVDVETLKITDIHCTTTKKHDANLYEFGRVLSTAFNKTNLLVYDNNIIMGQKLIYHLKNWREEGLVSTLRNIKRDFPFGPIGMRYWVTRVRNRKFPDTIILNRHIKPGYSNKFKTNTDTSTRPEYNVQDYGAVGDGSTDDSDAFQTAIKKADGGGRLYVPAGEYLIKPNVMDIYEGDLIIEGDGQQTVLRIYPMDFDSWGRYGFINIIGTGIKDRIEDVHIRNLTIDGNKNAHRGASGSCHELIRFSLAQNCSVVNITAKNAPDDAIQTHGSRWTLIASCTCFDNAGYGIHISEENFYVSTQNFVINNDVYNCGFETQHGGIDQTPHSFKNVYVGNTVSDCYMNYRIQGKRAVFKENKSKGNTQYPNILTGVNEKTNIRVYNFV